MFSLTAILSNPETDNWMDVITFQSEDIKVNQKENLKPILGREPSQEEKREKEILERNNRKKAGILMGKLHDDMMFLDKIAKHPALQKNILMLKEEDMRAQPRDIDKVEKNIFVPNED